MTFAFSLPAPSPGWTDARVDRLKVLYAEGLSCSQIAAALGHVSRNGIIGKVHRLKLERRGANSNRLVNGSKPGPKPKPKPERAAPRVTHESPEIKAMRCAEVVELHISLDELTQTNCHWPSGNAAPYTFCGNGALKGRPYCEPHFAISTKPMRGATS